MKNLKLLLLVPFMMLGLASCGNNEGGNTNNGGQVQTSWDFAAIGLMNNVLNGNTIPYFSEPGNGEWIGIPISITKYEEKYGIEYRIDTGLDGLVNKMAHTLENLGYDNITYEGGPLTYEFKLKDYDINRERIVCEPAMRHNNQTKEYYFSALFYYEALKTSWDSFYVANIMKNLFGVEVTIPRPDCFEFNMFESYITDLPQVRKNFKIGLYTDDALSSNKYVAQLEALGWANELVNPDDPNGGYYVYDPSGVVLMQTYYNARYGVCAIGIMVNEMD